MDLTRDPPHIYLEFQSQIHFIKMPSTHSKRRVMKVVLTIDSKGKKGTSILDIRIIWNKKKKNFSDIKMLKTFKTRIPAL